MNTETLTKTELVQIVLDHMKNTGNFEHKDALRFVDDFFEVIVRSLEGGNEVRIPGLGNLVLRDKSSRIGRNPKTKEEYNIEARRVVSFRTSNMLKEAIKQYHN